MYIRFILIFKYFIEMNDFPHLIGNFFCFSYEFIIVQIHVGNSWQLNIFWPNAVSNDGRSANVKPLVFYLWGALVIQ